MININLLPRDNFIFNILKENEINYKNFILHKYINCYSLYDINSNALYYRFDDSPNCFVDGKIFKFNFYNRDIVNKKNFNKIIQSFLELDYFILITIDTYYIQCYITNNHRPHEIYVKGYDNKLKIYEVYDYFDGLSYKKNYCTEKELLAAFFGHEKHNLYSNRNGILFLKLSDNKDLYCNRREIKNELSIFLDSTFDIEGRINYGITMFDGIAFQLNNERYYNAPYDSIISNLSFIFNHMKIMRERILILNEQELELDIKKIDDLLESFSIIINKCLYFKIKKIRYKNNLEQNFTIPILDFKKSYIEIIKEVINAL